MTDKEIIEMYTKPKPVTQDMIDRFLNSGNTGGTSDVSQESGTLHDVRESEPARSSADEGSKTSVESPLENRTESEKVYCVGCGFETDGGDICDDCYLDYESFPI